jgi:hypothetical protein
MVTQRTRRIGMTLAASGILLGVVAAPSLRGDEPQNRLGRLFRLGGPSSKASDPGSIGKTSSSMAKSSDSPIEGDAPVATPGLGSSSLTSHAPATPGAPGGANRIVPQARVNRAVTEADPLVTRVSLVRGDDGKLLCMFLQVFADGTVMDGEGVHRVGADSLRPIALVIQSGELDKLRGHCGGPAADFVDQVQVITYDRYRGRLRATSFSHSGNPQGCDPSVKTLNAALDALQAKLAGPPASSPGQPAPAAAPRAARPIGLTPEP